MPALAIRQDLPIRSAAAAGRSPAGPPCRHAAHGDRSCARGFSRAEGPPGLRAWSARCRRRRQRKLVRDPHLRTLWAVPTPRPVPEAAGLPAAPRRGSRQATTQPISHRNRLHDRTRMSHSKEASARSRPRPPLSGCAEIEAMVARTAPAILELLGDGTPRPRSTIITALADRHPKEDVVRTLMRLAVTGQLNEANRKYSLASASET
jgi:hypothetical protein